MRNAAGDGRTTRRRRDGRASRNNSGGAEINRAGSVLIYAGERRCLIFPGDGTRDDGGLEFLIRENDIIRAIILVFLDGEELSEILPG